MKYRRIAEYDFDPATQSSTLLREYIWKGWTPLAVIEGGQVYYVRADHIGRPVFATDDTGAKVWEGERRLGKAAGRRFSLERAGALSVPLARCM